MKIPRKKTSLLKIKQESNLKDMLAYYKDKSKVLQQQEPTTFEPIYEYEELLIEERKIVRNKVDSVALPYSYSSSENKRKDKEMGTAIRSRQLSTGDRKRGKQGYSREDVMEMNRRFRDIRTSQYKRNTQKMSEVVERE